MPTPWAMCRLCVGVPAVAIPALVMLGLHSSASLLWSEPPRYASTAACTSPVMP